MKTLTTCLSILLLIVVSCNTNKHISAAAIGLVNLENYTLKQNVDLPYSFNYMVVTSQADFDNTFGIATAGNINIIYPGFKGQTVIACVTQPSTSPARILFDKAEVAGKDLNVYCTTTDGDAEMKEATSAVALATVPKVLDVKRIVFYNNGEKIMTRSVDYKSENSAVTCTKTEDAKPVVLKKVMRRPAVI